MQTRPIPLSVLTFVLAATGFAVETDDANLDIVTRYLDATRTQQEVLRGAQMEVDIDAKLPRLEKQGKLRALRRISKLGQITYKALGFSGDNTVKKEVITRYLEAERDARSDGSIAIAPSNYRFRLQAIISREDSKVFIFHLTPKKKKVGLFKGELWLDGATGMPVRESGEFVKSPSVFLKKIQFVRDYELQAGVAIPRHIETKVDTRLVGRAELNIFFSHFTYPDSDAETEDAAETGH